MYLIFAKNCFIAQMEYRVNFFAGILGECGWLLVKLLYVVVIYGTGVKVGGIPADGMLIFVGTYTFMTGVYCAFFFFNFIRIPSYVREGTLDMFITKPISLQFIVTLRYLDYGTPIPNILGGLVMIIIGWKRLSIPLSFTNITGFIGFIVIGILLNYAIFLIPQLFAFWVVKVNSITDTANALWDLNTLPMGIYSKPIQRIGTFILPLFLITNFSPLFVLNKLSIFHMVWGIISVILFMVLSRLIWRYAIKSYTSASS